MQLTESSIYIGLVRLRNKLYQAQFLMDKSARIIYGTPLMTSCAETLKCFVIAFLVPSKKKEMLEEAIGNFAVLRTDLSFCAEQNIIHYKKKKRKLDDSGNPIDSEYDYVNTQKIELFKLIAQIDNDMCKWSASLAKGKTIIG